MSCICKLCGFEKGLTEDYTKWMGLVGLDAPLYPVTKNGQPGGTLHGFICARCLKSANSMRIFIKALVSGVQVTRHAIDRFIQRTKMVFPDEKTAKVAIIKAFSKSRQIRFTVMFQALRIINNQFKEANYYWNGGDLIFVTTKTTPATILTVEKPCNKRLNKDFIYVDEDMEVNI
jgi:hypothetical protein